MKKPLRTALPLLALAALAAAGCMLISGQIVVSFALPTPLNVTNTLTLTGVPVDLNEVKEYSKHKSDLKRVDDMALIGDFKNNSGSAAGVEVWIVPSGALLLTDTQMRAQGQRLWGPLSVAAGATEHVDWNRSAQLFVGRQALIDEIRGDGNFSLYVVANGSFNVTVTDGAVIAVVSAAK